MFAKRRKKSKGTTKMTDSRHPFLMSNRFLHGLNVYCYPVDYSGRFYDHWHHHEFDEIVIVRSGEGSHVTENGTYPIRKGDTFLIPFGNFHEYENLRNLRIANIIFHKNEWKCRYGDLVDSPGYSIFFENNTRFKEEFRFSNRLTLSDDRLQECEQIFSRMQLEQSGNMPGRNCMNELLFLNLCVIICRSFSNEEKVRSSEISDLSRLLRFMEENHSESWKLEDLARKINRSVSSLTALFRSALGTSPVEYLNTIRLEQAAKELRETEHLISAIAFAHGFSDSNYFSTRFSRHFGCSPREYRARQQNHPQQP